jgi:hypothetical protein
MEASPERLDPARWARESRTGPPSCPVNPASGCIACHMPKVQDATLQVRFTDHHMRVNPMLAGAAARGEDGTGPINR